MRMDMWEAAIAMFVDHPVLGIGWGAFKHVYPVYNELIQEAGIVIFHAHNMYLNILAETGLAGFFSAYGSSSAMPGMPSAICAAIRNIPLTVPWP